MTQPDLAMAPERYDWSTMAGYFCCPWCKQWEGLHMDRVRVSGDESSAVSVELHSAAGEDKGLPLAAKVLETDTPRGRRHTVSISSACELCGTAGWIHLVQHKGSTILHFMEDPALSLFGPAPLGKYEAQESNTDKKEL